MKRSIIAPLCIFALAATLAVCAGCAPGASSSASSASVGASSVDASEAFEDLGDAELSEGAASGQASPASQDSPAMKQVRADVAPIVNASGMDVGVCVIDLKSGARMDINGKDSVVAASMIKLAIAATFLEQVEKGTFSLDDTYVLKDTDIVGGTGSLGGSGAGAQVTYDVILEKMISESDNTAANILIDAVGMDAVNKTAKSLGLTGTQLNRLMMDEEAISAGIENYVSANDVAALLELAYKGELVSPTASKSLMTALSAQQDDHGILAGLPSDVTFAHKTGSLGNAQHDGGIVSVDGGTDFVIVVLCGGNGFSQQGAFDTMEEIGKVVYQDLQ